MKKRRKAQTVRPLIEARGIDVGNIECTTPGATRHQLDALKDEETTEAIIRSNAQYPLWVAGCEEFTNTEMLRIARFIAKWNGMKLVKEPKEVK